MPKRRAHPILPALLLPLFLLSLLPAPVHPRPHPHSLTLPAPVLRQTVVSRCDDWVSIYANYWARFPQCHQGLASPQCCELYDLMDKSVRIFQQYLNCTVTNLDVFTEKYNAHCRGTQISPATPQPPQDDAPGQPVPDENVQGGHGDEDGIILLPDGTTQMDQSRPPPTDGTGSTTPPSVTDTAPTSGTSGTGVQGGHGCGSTAAGCQTTCHQCCTTCCTYNTARQLILPRSQKTHGGDCINCGGGNTGCTCTNFDCNSSCRSCGGGTTQPTTAPAPVPQQQCHQCCSSCCRTARVVQLLTGRKPQPVSALSTAERSGCECSTITCNVHCTACGNSGDSHCNACTNGCQYCPVNCHAVYNCGGTGSGKPPCNTCSTGGESGGSDPNANSGGTGASNDDDDTRPVQVGAKCFAGDAMVQMKDGAKKRMDEVQVGDMVHVGHGKYSEVFMFTHRSKTHSGMFVNVHTEVGILSATQGHFVHSSRGVRVVDSLQVGDSLLMADGTMVRINGIVEEMKEGLYNPQTLHGDIVVDGFLATSYTNALQPETAQSFLAPLRALYRTCGQGCGEALGGLLFPERTSS